MNYETGLSVEEKVGSLFQPDTLLSAQFFETFRRKTPLEPEKRLMLAVLEDAVACFQKYVHARDNRGKTMFREAEEWIMEKNNDWLFSFEMICETLGLNPDYVRQGLMRWKETNLSGRSRTNVYRLAPRSAKRQGGAAVSSNQGNRRWLKAAGRR
jgi:hypothetical protein